MPLKSQLFRGNPRLEAAAVQDSAHVTPGSRGDAVALVQTALNIVFSAELEPDGVYGSATANAVLAYKTDRRIINPAYQTAPDNIVGRMTVAALDEELIEQESVPAYGNSAAEVVSGVIDILQRLQQNWINYRLPPSAAIAIKYQHLCASARCFPGVYRTPTGYISYETATQLSILQQDTREITARSEPMVIRASLVLGAAPLIALFESLMVTLAAVLVMIKLIKALPAMKRELTHLLNEVVGLGTQAVVDLTFGLERLSAFVDICRRHPDAMKPECILAMSKFAEKKDLMLQKKAGLQEAIQALRQRDDGVMVEFIVRRARALIKELKNDFETLHKLAKDVADKCNCRLLGDMLKPTPDDLLPIDPNFDF